MTLFQILQLANAAATNEENDARKARNDSNPCYPCDDKGATVDEDVRDNIVYVRIAGFDIAFHADGAVKFTTPDTTGWHPVSN